MKAFLQPRQPIYWRRFASQALVMLPASLFAGCEASDPESYLEPPKLVVTAEVPFFELALSIDAEGEMELTPRISPEKRLNLGPVGLRFGIEETVKLMGERPYHLFILWEQEDGTVRRDEYEIGKRFSVQLDPGQRVSKIEGDGESVLIVVGRIEPWGIPDSGLQVHAVEAVVVEPRLEQEPAPEPEIVIQRAVEEEDLTESRLDWEPEFDASSEDEPSDDSRAWVSSSREQWDRRPARSRRVNSEGVPLTVSVFGDFNDIYVEEAEDSYIADMGDFEVVGERGRYMFRLLKGKGAVITLRGRGNRVYNPPYLDGRVRLDSDR